MVEITLMQETTLTRPAPGSPRRMQTRAQLAASVLGFVVVTLLLDSGGLAEWADRLEIGPLRSVAAPVCSAIHARLAPLGFERVRTAVIADLGKVGWSDDPAAGNVEAAGDTPANPAAGNPGAGAADGHAGDAGTGGNPGGMRGKTPASSGSIAENFLPALPEGKSLPPLAPVAPGQVRTVCLAGDSMMAVGIYARLVNEMASHPDLAIVRAFKSGTGLARPEIFDWQREYPAMLAGRKPDVVLVALGANDAQGYVVDGKVQAFGSEAWIATYEARVEAYLTMLTQDGAQVVWLGLPPMRSQVFDGHIALINRIDAAVVARFPRAVWWSPSAFVADADGKFEEFGPAAGDENARLRQADGIHFSDVGAGLFTPKLVAWLDPPAGSAKGQGESQ